MSYNSFVYDLGEDLKPENGIKAKCIVQFRTSGNYNGEYGFDWLRGGDSGRPGDTWYAEIMGRYRDPKNVNDLKQIYSKGIFTKSVAEYDKFARQYKRHMIVWKRKTGSSDWVYCVPVMTLLKGKEAVLTLKVEVVEKAAELKYLYDEKYFQLSKTDVPILEKGKHTLADELTIKCIEEFAEDQTIAVIAKNEQSEEVLAGRLIIKANSQPQRKQVNIAMVRVKSNISNVSKSPNKSPNRILRLKKYFDQCYITANIIYLELDVTSPQQRIKDFIKYANGGNIVYNHVEDVLSYLSLLLANDYPAYKDFYRIYLVDQTCKAGQSQILLGLSKGIPSKEAVVFKEGLDKATCAHEIFHSLGLYHSYDNDSDFTFEKFKTDNLMDYSKDIKDDHRIALWQFQSRIVRNALPAESEIT